MKFRFRDKRKNKILPINSLLNSIVTEFDLEERFLFESIKTAWKEIVGEILSTHSIPNRIFRNNLYITADHSVYSNEILLLKDSIKNRIAEEMGFKAINNIKVEVKSINWSK